MDEYGIDPLISLIWGEGSVRNFSSALMGLYLVVEGYNARIGVARTAKIVALQAADAAIGYLGEVDEIKDTGAPKLAVAAIDTMFKANVWSTKYFDERVEELLRDAAKAGISVEELKRELDLELK